jgi:curved DNA-binding protein CbpA
MTYQVLKQALAELGLLSEQASLSEVKRHFRRLVKLYHPDKGEAADPERMRRINEAYKLTRDYCENYRYSFSEDEFYRQNPEAHLERQFATDPVWGGLEPEDEPD